MALKGTGHIKRVSYWFLAIILLLISGSVMMARTINQYNNLSLQRQDQQLEELSLAVDANIASQLNNIRKDLRYVISRRGFLEAEKQWQQIGDHADLLGRIKENLIMQNPMIHAMLAVHDDEIILSTDGNLCYYFPAGMTQSMLDLLPLGGLIHRAAVFDDW